MTLEIKSLDHYPAEILELSHSTLSNFHSCPRKLEFSKLFGISTWRDSGASLGGTAMHLAMGVYLETKDKDKAIFCFMLNYPTHLKQDINKWSLISAYSTLITLFDWIDKQTHLELAKIGDKNAVEVPFLINILHKIEGLMPVVYRGYIDFIFYNRLLDKYIVVDLKNTTFNMEDFTPKYKFDPQCLPYGLVLNRALGLDIKELDVEYLVTKISLLEPTINPLEFTKTEQDIREWAQDLLVDLTAIKTYIQTQWFPRRVSGCVGYGRPCGFYNICDSRKLKTINLMLKSMEQPDPREFEPWITLDLEIG